MLQPVKNILRLSLPLNVNSLQTGETASNFYHQKLNIQIAAKDVRSRIFANEEMLENIKIE